MTFDAFEVVSGFVIGCLGLLSLRVAMAQGRSAGWWARAPEGPLAGHKPLVLALTFGALGVLLIVHGLIG